MAFASTIEQYYENNIPPWMTVDHYVETYRQNEVTGTAVSVFKALESTCADDVGAWREKAARFMCDENQLLNVISSFSKEITSLRQATYDKDMPTPKRENHYRRMATLNSSRKKKQDQLNLITDVLILICRRIRKLSGARAGNASHTDKSE